jgi:hypothetical protein
MTAPGPVGPPLGQPPAPYGPGPVGPGSSGGGPGWPSGYAAPAPPRGPGVRPPFVTPPIDGTRRRRWLAIGLTIGTVLLCLIGSVAGLGGLGLLAERAASDAARATVTRYLTALQHRAYGDAYRELCVSLRSHTDRSDFAHQFETGPAITSFEVGPAQIDNDLGDVKVGATVSNDRGETRHPTYSLVQEGQPGEYRVCGTRD